MVVPVTTVIIADLELVAWQQSVYGCFMAQKLCVGPILNARFQIAVQGGYCLWFSTLRAK